MYEVPKAITIDGETFKIRKDGDYRMVIDCFMALDDPELEKKDRISAAMIIFYEGIDSVSDFVKFPDVEKAFKEMGAFFNCGQTGSSNSINYKLIDWERDSQLICSAVNNVAKVEIRDIPYLHWWTFMGYYMSAGDSVLGTVISIRNKIVKGQKRDKGEQEFMRNNPQYFAWSAKNAEQQALDEEARKLWNSGK